jgi:hypothetical protein
MKKLPLLVSVGTIAFPLGIVLVIAGSRVFTEPWLLVATIVLTLSTWNTVWSYSSMYDGVATAGAAAGLGAKLSGAVISQIVSITAVVLAVKHVHVWQGIATLTAILILASSQMTHRVVSEKVSELNERIEVPSSHADWGVRITILAGRASANAQVSNALRKLGDDCRFLARDVVGLEAPENAMIELAISDLSTIVAAQRWTSVEEAVVRLRQLFDERELVLRHYRSGR